MVAHSSHLGTWKAEDSLVYIACSRPARVILKKKKKTGIMNAAIPTYVFLCIEANVMIYIVV